MSVNTDLGKVAVTNGGEWDSSFTYEKLTVVTNVGSSYISKQDVPAGTALSNTNYWQLVASKGATGNTGNGIASIQKTLTVGKVDTYTIMFTNGTTSTFTVTNGADAIYDALGLSIVDGKLCVTYED